MNTDDQSTTADPAIPLATYRLQLNKDFDFRAARKLVPYLHALGISHCYLSPYLRARPGSGHGYDIVDHTTINPEIGSDDDFVAFTDALKQHGMGVIADIVPNHMAVMGQDNQWWLDVLEHGEASQYAGYFDIDWNPINPHLKHKVLLPVLGDQYGRVLAQGQLQLRFDAGQGEFSVFYYEHRFPIDPKFYPDILTPPDKTLRQRFQQDHLLQLEYQSLVTSFEKLPPHTAANLRRMVERRRDATVFKQHLCNLCAENAFVAEFIERRVAAINEAAGTESDPLHTLLEKQPYRLAYWRVAGDEINYRRFFDINELAGLRAEDEAVFDDTHRLILDQIEQGRVQGLRIDHADGLYDPMAYYRRLNSKIAQRLGRQDDDDAPPLYIVAEKIVANYEYLANEWPIHGTTGYEFADVTTGLLVNADVEKPLSATYRRFVARPRDFDELLYQAKQQIMHNLLSSELNVLANALNQISEANPLNRDYTLNALHDALREVVACFPVYRTYINSAEIGKADRQYIEWAVAAARRRSRSADKSIFEFICRVLLLEPDQVVAQSRLIAFVMKVQQYTAPVMAKGYEDTALYQYHRLTSLNDVGSDPRRFGYSPSAFHLFNQARVTKWPHTMLCSTTHDSKRSADTRCRINVLSECAQRWQTEVLHWGQLNRSHKRRIGNRLCPTRNDEYLFYQTLIGIWPPAPPGDEERERLHRRLQAYMTKALREAKQHTSWLNVDEAYEQATAGFVERCLDPKQSAPFLEEVDRFVQDIAVTGFHNALAHTILKLTSPGVPDIYQGDELWQFMLVDPDNRHAVDFEQRRRHLQQLTSQLEDTNTDRAALAGSLFEHVADGRIKLFVTSQTLQFRKRHAALFQHGDYLKLAAEGVRSEQLVAFTRRYASDAVLVIVPRLLMRDAEDPSSQPIGDYWSDTRLVLPDNTPARYRDIFTDRQLEVREHDGERCLELSEALSVLPFCVLSAE
jgi:(1->4)-alpha-D-glucan 1-alpha-D-glucosylmutase